MFEYQQVIVIFILACSPLFYLLNTPWYEKQHIFGIKWLITKWNLSKLAVWAPVESFGMSFCICLDIASSSNSTHAMLPLKKMTIINFFINCLVILAFLTISFFVHVFLRLKTFSIMFMNVLHMIADRLQLFQHQLPVTTWSLKDDYTGSWSKVAGTRNS